MSTNQVPAAARRIGHLAARALLPLLFALTPLRGAAQEQFNGAGRGPVTLAAYQDGADPQQAEINQLRAEINRLTTENEQLKIALWGVKGEHVAPIYDSTLQKYACPLEDFQMTWIIVDKWDTTTDRDDEGNTVEHVVNRRKEFDRTCVRK